MTYIPHNTSDLGLLQSTRVYNEPGYNELQIIQTNFDGPFKTPIASMHYYPDVTKSFITNTDYSERFFVVP